MLVHILAISVPGWIWCFASSGYPLCIFQGLKALLPVADTVWIYALVICGFHITALLLLPVILVLGRYHW